MSNSDMFVVLLRQFRGDRFLKESVGESGRTLFADSDLSGATRYHSEQAARDGSNRSRYSNRLATSPLWGDPISLDHATKREPKEPPILERLRLTFLDTEAQREEEARRERERLGDEEQRIYDSVILQLFANARNLSMSLDLGVTLPEAVVARLRRENLSVNESGTKVWFDMAAPGTKPKHGHMRRLTEDELNSLAGLAHAWSGDVVDGDRRASALAASKSLSKAVPEFADLLKTLVKAEDAADKSFVADNAPEDEAKELKHSSDLAKADAAWKAVDAELKHICLVTVGARFQPTVSRSTK